MAYLRDGDVVGRVDEGRAIREALEEESVDVSCLRAGETVHTYTVDVNAAVEFGQGGVVADGLSKREIVELIGVWLGDFQGLRQGRCGRIHF